MLSSNRWMELTKHLTTISESKKEQVENLINEINSTFNFSNCLSKLNRIKIICEELLQLEHNSSDSPINIFYQQINFILLFIFKEDEIFYINKEIAKKRLTTREKEILKYIILGYTAKKIGRTLNLSFRTVEKYIEILKIKFNCDSKSALIEDAIMRYNIFMFSENLIK